MSEPHPGIAPPGPGESLTYHKYYQWVIFFFFVQGVMFYLPRLFWKHSEGGLMKSLVGGLTDPLIPYQVNNSHCFHFLSKWNGYKKSKASRIERLFQIRKILIEIDT